MSRERYFVDAFDLGVNEKGINRVLECLVPPLRDSGENVVFATTAAGAERLGGGPDLLVVQRTKQSMWEQWGLPVLATRIGCASIYSHREAGPLWGPPLVLHVPEDPEVRWSREPISGLNDTARRAYSRALMRRSLRRAQIVAASVPSVAQQLQQRYHVAAVTTIPLGVDHMTFSPASRPREDCIFHLGSVDPRDQTEMVVKGYLAAAETARLPPLVIAGNLGGRVGGAVERVMVGRAHATEVLRLGWISDDRLADLYKHSMLVVQLASDEGFGLQPLESLASGAPLIVADSAAVRDVVGEAACFVDAKESALRDGLLALAASPQRRTRLRQAGVARASRYGWEETALRVLLSLRLAAGTQAVGE